MGLRETAGATTGAGLLMVAALIPFSTADFIIVRALGVGIAVAVLLDVLILRPVLLPAGEAVLGRFGWWPTEGLRPSPPQVSEPAGPAAARRGLPRPHLPHRGPRPAR